MKKTRTLVLSLILPLILSACATLPSQADQEAGVDTTDKPPTWTISEQAKGDTAKSKASGVSLSGPSGGIAAAMVAEYIDKQERAFELVFPPSEETYVQREENNLLVTFKSDILFDSDSTQLKSDAYGEIQHVAEIVNKYPHTRLVINGYTDSTGSEAHNMKLSAQRAEAVKEALVGKKVAPQRMTAHGYGESRPIVSNATEHGKLLNRRVTIEIIPIKSK